MDIKYYHPEKEELIKEIILNNNWGDMFPYLRVFYDRLFAVESGKIPAAYTKNVNRLREPIRTFVKDLISAANSKVNRVSGDMIAAIQLGLKK